jgi:hypothetical protein
MRLTEDVARMAQLKCMQDWVVKIEVQGPMEKSRRRWKNNIKADLK